MSGLERTESTTTITGTLSILEKMNSFDDSLSSNYKLDNLSPKRPRFNSTNALSTYEEKELLSNISKNQRRMSGCYEDKIDSSERENLIEKIERTLKNMKLTNEQRSSIYHGFCNLFRFFNEKLCATNEDISVAKDLKIISGAILLLSFKLEGLIINKKFIFDLISSYFNEFEEKFIDEDFNEIFSYEIKIVKILESSPEIINDNNLYKLSFFLFELFMNKYPDDIDEDQVEDIKNEINYCNQLIEGKYNIVYNLYPIDKALMSFYSSAKFILQPDKNLISKLNDFYSYLKANLENSKISKRDFEINCKDIITSLKHKN